MNNIASSWASGRSRLVITAVLATALVLSSAARVTAHYAFDTEVNGKVKRGAYTLGLYRSTYDSGNEFGMPYGVIDLTDVQVYFDDSFPDARKPAISRAAARWNRVGGGYGQDLQFAVNTTEPITADDYDGYCDTDYESAGETDVVTRDGHPLSMIYWEGLGGTYLGLTRLCLHNFKGSSTYQPWAFKQVYNSEKRWYSKEGRNLPGDRFDLDATASHELGHATGWFAHYDRGWLQIQDPTNPAPPELPGSERCDADDPDRWTMCSEGKAGVAWERSLEIHDRHTFAAAYPDQPPPQP